MKIEIEINEPYLTTLKKWASVSRTLNKSIDIIEQDAADLEAMMERLKDDNDKLDEMNMNLEELRALEPALNALHQALREVLNIKDRDRSIAEKLAAIDNWE